jgi:fatty-acyl-CoA synthase
MPVYRRELTPLDFLERAGEAFADRLALVDGALRLTWRELRARSRRLASALRKNGMRKGDRVAFLALNSEPLLLAHFGVPLGGGVLVAINTRLNADEVAYIVEHSGATLVFVTPELRGALARVPPSMRVVDLGREWEPFLASGSEAPIDPGIASEDEPITINYTSGTTGRPKGVVYHHRGAYLNALAMALDHRLTSDSS